MNAIPVRAHTRQRGMRLSVVREHQRSRAWKPGDPLPTWNWQPGQSRRQDEPWTGEADEEEAAMMNQYSPVETVWMSPERFYALITGGGTPLSPEEMFQRIKDRIGSRRFRDLVRKMRAGEEIDPVVMWFLPDRTWEPSDVGGLHRAAAAAYLGISKIPVEMYGTGAHQRRQRREIRARGLAAFEENHK